MQLQRRLAVGNVQNVVGYRARCRIPAGTRAR